MGVNEIKQEICKYERSIDFQQQALDKPRNQSTEETKSFVKNQLKSEVESRPAELRQQKFFIVTALYPVLTLF